MTKFYFQEARRGTSDETYKSPEFLRSLLMRCIDWSPSSLIGMCRTVLNYEDEAISTELNESNELYLMKIWYAVLFMPFQYLVEVSCILTVLLSASRMIAVVKPLKVISEKIVWATLLLVMMVFLGTMIGKWYVLFKTETDKSLSYAAQIELPETIVIGLFVVIVAVCSSMTVKSLKAPAAIGEMPNVRQDGSQQRRATVMILILSLVFILINGGWIAALFVANGQLTSEMPSGDVFLVVLFLTIAIIPINSIVNPLIYIARNTTLNEYAKGILTQVVRVR